MKWLIIILLGFCSTAQCEEDISALVQNLDNEDFEVREDATKSLTSFSSSYVDIFLKLSESYEDKPEISYRLNKIAETIYKTKTVRSEPKWQGLMNKTGLTVESVEINPDCGKDNEYNDNFTCYGFLVNSISFGGPSHEKLEYYDLIYEINGFTTEGVYPNSACNELYKRYYALDDSKQYAGVPGETLKLKIKRFNAKSLKRLEEEGTWPYVIKELLEDKNNFTVHEVEFKSTYKEEYEVDQEELQKLVDWLWNQHIDKFYEK